MRHWLSAAVAFLAIVIMTHGAARAAWIEDGIAVAPPPGYIQIYPSIASDGEGGAIIAWEDGRNGGYYDIYAQRLDAYGMPLWTAGGVAVCNDAGYQQRALVVNDGAGGAIVAWIDQRSGAAHIYAQRLDADGNALWTANGVPVYAGAYWPSYINMTSDGHNGAIFAWNDNRTGVDKVYAQRVGWNGNTVWTANGVAVSSSTGIQWMPAIASDGSYGAFVVWSDSRSGNYDIYVNRVKPNGAVVWSQGVQLCSATNNQGYPDAASDGLGGVITAWEDYRDGVSYNIYAARFDSSGAYGFNDIAVCTSSNTQEHIEIVADGAGGAILAWQDERTTLGYPDIYAQRLAKTGSIVWTTGGIAVCTALGYQSYPVLVGDGSGGAVISWTDMRNGNGDIYAQRVSESGTALWTAQGAKVCTYRGDQNNHRIASDGRSGAIMTWIDPRTNPQNVYAQRIERSGYWGYPCPAITDVSDVIADQGGKALVTWDPSRLDAFPTEVVTHYTIWRSLSAPAAAQLLSAGAQSVDPATIERGFAGKAYRFFEMNGSLYGWELIGNMDSHYLSSYSFTAPTLSDSIAGHPATEYFFISAHTSNRFYFWDSKPDSGYSVDNLPPGAPIALAGEQSFSPAGLNLTWHPNGEADLANYAVYRGTTPDFAPSSGNRVASPRDTLCFDADWHWSGGYYYKVSAVDVHGNESGFALLTPDDVTGNDTPKAPEASYLAQNYPNPFNPTTRIALGLAAPAHVSLRIYDAAGRLVRVLVNEERRAGRYEESWDGRDSSGRTVASGVYFCRLSAGGFEETRKMAIMR